MRLKTILNSGLNFKCFCIGKSEFNEKKDSIIVEIKARTNSKPVCSICGTSSPGYDSLPERLFEFVPLWGLRVFFRYAMRRVSCPRCQRVVVEKVPWSDGKIISPIITPRSLLPGQKNFHGRAWRNIFIPLGKQSAPQSNVWWITG